MSKVSASANVNQKTQKLTLVLSTIIGAGSLVIFLLLLFASRQLREIKTQRQQQSTQVQSSSASEEIASYIQANQADVERLLRVFPTEESFVNALQVLEALIRQYDPQATVELSALSPNKFNNQLAVPLSIKYSATISQHAEFLRQVERLPYVVEVTNFTSQYPGGITNKAEINLGVRLYVHDPFIKP